MHVTATATGAHMMRNHWKLVQNQFMTPKVSRQRLPASQQELETSCKPATHLTATFPTTNTDLSGFSKASNGLEPIFGFDDARRPAFAASITVETKNCTSQRMTPQFPLCPWG
jgi:hypothetical protein